jgi:hypothetical protein
MADLKFIYSFVVDKFNKKEDKNKDNEITEKFEIKETTLDSIFSMISIIFACIAFYLSWNCNSKCYPNMSNIEKIVRGLIASSFGFTYILIYLIFWSSLCQKCIKQ